MNRDMIIGLVLMGSVVLVLIVGVVATSGSGQQSLPESAMPAPSEMPPATP